MKVINAKGLIMGRLASSITKDLLAGESIVVVNVSDAVISGTLAQEVRRLNSLKHQKSKRNPENSPKYPRVPHLMFKRIVRGMLPKKNSRGRDALHRLRAYPGIPAGVDASQAVTMESISKKPVRATTLGAVCKAFSYDVKA